MNNEYALADSNLMFFVALGLVLLVLAAFIVLICKAGMKYERDKEDRLAAKIRGEYRG